MRWTTPLLICVATWERGEVLDFGVEREGHRVILAVRDKAGRRATINIPNGAANALAASIALCSSSDTDTSAEFSLRGDLETKEPERIP